MTYLRVPDDGLRAPNYEKIFALAPDAYAGWRSLGAAVRGGMDERRYELVTLTAARRLGSRYCTLAHAAVLRARFYDDAALDAIVADRHAAGLDPADVAATETDFEALRARGLSEVDIFHVVLAVAIRRFFAGVLDAVGAVPDTELEEGTVMAGKAGTGLTTGLEPRPG